MFKLIRGQTSTEVAFNNRGLWPVSYSAYYTGSNLPAAIFVMQLSPNPGVLDDELSCVASAIQMTDLPVDAPESGSPFYRLATVTKVFKDAVTAAAFVEKIKDAVQDLANNLYASTQLGETDDSLFEPLDYDDAFVLVYGDDALTVNSFFLALAPTG